MEDSKKDQVIELQVQWSNHWDDFVDRHIVDGRLVVDDWDLKRYYLLRSKYLKCWISTFIENYKDIKNGKSKMPTFFWLSPHSTFKSCKGFDIPNFHESCDSKKEIEECDCIYSVFFKSWFGKDCKSHDKLAHDFTIVHDTFCKILKTHRSRKDVSSNTE